jgi:zinc protease
LPMGNFYTYPRRIQAVTLEQVNRVARELFFPDNLLIVTVSPAP